MPRIKNWKKEKDDKYHVVWRNTKDIKATVEISNYEGEYELYVWEENKNIYLVHGTKELCYNYAIKYMKEYKERK